MKNSMVRRAANEFSQGNYRVALDLYRGLADRLGEENFRLNIALCEKRLRGQGRPDYAQMPLRAIKVACVMDEFTFHSYAPECNLLPLTPDNALGELEAFKPDLLFIESAWQGKDQSWKLKISTNGPEINACIQWCKERGIPTLFWNKEDPVHFGTFLPLAKQVDYVFTTDIDCIPKYKRHMGHARVYLLPFAAQPLTHNPLELYERKDAFNFAGSYYLRYPERQRDFAALIDTVKKFRPVEIYDRNADNPHPHYTFPDHYKPMILGKLPFAEIDRAYKAYRYGINMNTIKQSQTMFARRVFELLASNTVVVSNFSRGMRLLFGDLVISSDDASQLQKRVEEIVKDDVRYRKFRLLGLRKVMAEHTYAHRLAYIRAKLCGQDYTPEYPPVALLGVADTQRAYQSLCDSFARQRYPNRQLVILDRTDGPLEPMQGVQAFPDPESCIAAIERCADETWVGLFHPQDYYGAQYLTDLVQGGAWSSAPAFGKFVRYTAQTEGIRLQHDGKQYRPVETLPARAALVRLKALPSGGLKESLTLPSNANLQLPGMLALDEFNYIEQGANLAESLKLEVDDLQLSDTGISFSGELALMAEQLPAENAENLPNDHDGLPTLDGEALRKLLVSSGQVRLGTREGQLRLISKSAGHTYIYASKTLGRAELNLETQSQFQLYCSGDIEIRTVFEFYNATGVKISHQMNAAGEKHALAIPNDCARIRLGLRVAGRGEGGVEKLVLGSCAERPAAIVCRSPYLVLSKQYPAYDDLYSYGFLHSRVWAYKEHGLLVDVFRLRSDSSSAPYHEYEGIDVATGNAELLTAILRSGRVKHVLAHLLDKQMWEILRPYLDSVKVTVWVHGADISTWQRRLYNFEHAGNEEIARQKRLSEQRMKLWHSIVADPHPNLHLVFVSGILRNEALEDLGLPEFPRQTVSIIHNFIDGTLFPQGQKDPEKRLRLLSLRPFTSRQYANDLTVKAILELSERPFFRELFFHLIGDGELFEETIMPLHNFENVRIEQRFLAHQKIADLHKDYGIFLCPTRWDSQGVSRDEAMASGLVPITNKVAAIPEFVDETCGMVVPPEDYVAMADAVEKLYHDQELFIRMSEAAAKRVRQQCNFDLTIKREMDLIDR